MCDNGGEPLNVMKHPRRLAPKVMFVLKLIMSSFSVAIFLAPRVSSLERLREKTSQNSRLLQFLQIISCTKFFGQYDYKTRSDFTRKSFTKEAVFVTI